MESIPQTHLTWILVVMVVDGPGLDDYEGLETVMGNTTEKRALFILSFTTSIISASWGMSRLLLSGPSKFVRKTGRLGGYFQWGFVLLILSIMSGIIAKAAWLPLVINWPTNLGSLGAILWIGVSLIPQLLLVRVVRSSLSF